MLVLYADSAAGKGVLVDYLLNKGYTYLPSNTDREARVGEKEGYEYNFYTKEEFNNMIDQDLFYHHLEVYGTNYGTLKSDVENLDNKVAVFVEGAIKLFKKDFNEDIKVVYISIDESRRHDFLKLRGETNKKRYEKITSEDKSFIDYIIYNNGTKQDLFDQLEDIISKKIQKR